MLAQASHCEIRSVRKKVELVVNISLWRLVYEINVSGYLSRAAIMASSRVSDPTVSGQPVFTNAVRVTVHDS